MKVVETKITKLTIREIEGLNDVTVALQDIETGRGKIAIECYSESWTACWREMEGRTIAEFFCSCDERYLVGNFSDTEPQVIDYESVISQVKKEIIKARRYRELSHYDARGLFDDAKNLVPGNLNHEYMYKIYGDQWWCSLPMKPNPEQEYLCRIIKTVKQALRPSTANAVT